MAAAGAAAVAMWVSTALATASTVYAAVSARNRGGSGNLNNCYK